MHPATIHILRKELGLSEDKYRYILRAAGGVSSSRNLSDEAGKEVVAYLRKLSSAEKKAARYVWVLWKELRNYLPPCDRGGVYLAGFANRAGVRLADLSELDGLSAGDLHKLIEALKTRLKYEQEKAAEAAPF